MPVELLAQPRQVAGQRRMGEAELRARPAAGPLALAQGRVPRHQPARVEDALNHHQRPGQRLLQHHQAAEVALGRPQSRAVADQPHALAGRADRRLGEHGEASPAHSRLDDDRLRVRQIQVGQGPPAAPPCPAPAARSRTTAARTGPAGGPPRGPGSSPAPASAAAGRTRRRPTRRASPSSHPSGSRPNAGTGCILRTCRVRPHNPRRVGDDHLDHMPGPRQLRGHLPRGETRSVRQKHFHIHRIYTT